MERVFPLENANVSHFTATQEHHSVSCQRLLSMIPRAVSIVKNAVANVAVLANSVVGTEVFV